MEANMSGERCLTRETFRAIFVGAREWLRIKHVQVHVTDQSWLFVKLSVAMIAGEIFDAKMFSVDVML